MIFVYIYVFSLFHKFINCNWHGIIYELLSISTVVYDSCPRSFDSGLWWDRTLFGELAIQSCPEGTVGK